MGIERWFGERTAHAASRCIIHVGTRKTGTSSIQRSLDGFSNEAFAYANINGHPNHGAALYSLFADDPAKLAFHRISRRTASELEHYIRAARDGLEKSIQSAGRGSVIYSGEAISYLFTREELTRLRDYFVARRGTVEVLGAVRPPAGFVSSNFQERVKHAASKIEMERDYLDYRNTFDKFDAVFGRESVRLWKFDPAVFPGGCAVRDFCARVGIDLPAERIVRVNESLSREAVGLLFTYRRLGRELGSMTMSGPQNQHLVERLMGIRGGKFRFSPEVMRPILERNRADIEWMEARLGQSLQEDLGEHEAGDVRDESDLLRVDARAVEQLRVLLGEAAPRGVKGETAEEVAQLVHALRGPVVPTEATKRGAGRAAARRGEGEMQVSELIETVRRAEPELLRGMDAGRAVALVQGVFRQVNAAVAGTRDGVLRYEGLGQFRVRQVERDAGGARRMRTVVSFRGSGNDDAKD